MARSFTRGQIRTRARALSNLEGGFPSDAQVNDLINVYLCDLYDWLVQAGPPDYFSSSTNISTISGTVAYALPADFRTVSFVYANELNGVQLRPIRRINDFDRAYYRAPQGTYQVTVEYIPAPPVWTQDSDAFDGISGWEELIVKMVARDMLRKEGSDTSALERDIIDHKARIRTMSGLDKGQTRYIMDVETANTWLYPFGVNVWAYRLRRAGSAGTAQIELFEPTVPLP